VFAPEAACLPQLLDYTGNIFARKFKLNTKNTPVGGQFEPMLRFQETSIPVVFPSLAALGAGQYRASILAVFCVSA
jgi:hypothetical protein